MEITFDTIIEMLVCLILLIHVILSNANKATRITDVRYTPLKYKQMRYKFDGLEKVTRNYSQVYQDLFVLSMLDGKREGTYLEIGSADPYINSNTALLEKDFN